MPLMGGEDLQNLLKFAYSWCSSALLRQLCLGCTAHRAQAPPCPSTGTRSDRHFLDFHGACARGGGGGYFTHIPAPTAATAMGLRLVASPFVGSRVPVWPIFGPRDFAAPTVLLVILQPPRFMPLPPPWVTQQPLKHLPENAFWPSSCTKTGAVSFVGAGTGPRWGVWCGSTRDV